MQRQVSRLLLKAMLCGAVAGALMLFAVPFGATSGAAWGVGLAAAALGMFWVGESRFGIPALDAAKDQDRAFFLECLRSAQACNHLEWCGLFAPPGARKEPLARERVEEIARNLRAALYNDEWMNFTPARRRSWEEQVTP